MNRKCNGKNFFPSFSNTIAGNGQIMKNRPERPAYGSSTAIATRTYMCLQSRTTTEIPARQSGMNWELYSALTLSLLLVLSAGCSSNKKDYRPLGEPTAGRGLRSTGAKQAWNWFLTWSAHRNR